MPNRFFRFFFPEDVDFFAPMARMLELISRGADIYIEAAGRSGLTAGEKSALLATLKSLESDGDAIIKKTSADLKRTFTPPFSPIELVKMFESLDNALDLLDESAKIIIHANYRDGFPPFVKKQLEAFRAGIEEAKKLPESLKNPRKHAKQIASITAEMGKREKEGDMIYWDNKKALSSVINGAADASDLHVYRRGRMDEMALDMLEKLVDTLLEMIRNTEDMVIDHA